MQNLYEIFFYIQDIKFRYKLLVSNNEENISNYIDNCIDTLIDHEHSIGFKCLKENISDNEINILKELELII